MANFHIVKKRQVKIMPVTHIISYQIEF